MRRSAPRRAAAAAGAALLLCGCSAAYRARTAAEQAFHEGRFEQAFRLYDRAVRLDPEGVAARIGRADSAQKLGRFRQARDDCARVLARYPEDTDALFIQAWAEYALTDDPACRATLEALLAGEPKHAAGWFLLAYIALRRGLADTAREHFVRAERLGYKKERVRFFTVMIDAARGPLAPERLRVIREIDDAFLRAALLLAAGQGDPAALLDAAAQNPAPSPYLAGLAHFSIAQVLHLKGEDREALPHLAAAGRLGIPYDYGLPARAELARVGRARDAPTAEVGGGKSKK